MRRHPGLACVTATLIPLTALVARRDRLTELVWVAAAAKIEIDDPIDIREERGWIVVEPLRLASYDLVDLMKKITPGNLHDEFEFRPEGRQREALMARYVLDAGDIVWLKFAPQFGWGQAGHRPRLVLSPAVYNSKTSLMIWVSPGASMQPV